MRRLPNLFLIALAIPAAAQMGEQTPRRVPDTVRSPDTGPSGVPVHGRKEKVSSKNAVPDAVGKVVRNDGKVLIIQADDTRYITCTLSPKTAFVGPEGKLEANEIEPGTRVRIRVSADSEDNYTAVSVTVENETEKPKNEITATMRTADSGADTDEDRPVLRRGKPKKSASSDEEVADEAPAPAKHEANTAATNEAPSGDGEGEKSAPSVAEPKRNALLTKAYEVNRQFTKHLPNFVCHQLTTRYEQFNKVQGWKAIDVISAEVSFVDGQEKYENIKVGNRSVKEQMMDIKGGSRSQGEFGSVLEGLFATDVAAQFQYENDEFYRRLPAAVFRFTVARETSDWTILHGGVSILPAYSGKIWVDKQTGRVLRMERQADNVPEAFPLDTIEQTVDYDWVMIGTHKALLPVESRNLACERGSPYCSRNVIAWRDYREFGAESTVDFKAK